METRICSRCDDEKPLTLEFFMQGKNKRDGVEIPYWYKFCKICYNKKAIVKNSKYKRKNRAKLSADQKIYYQNNKKACSDTKKQCYQKRKSYYLGKAKTRLYERRKTDINLILKEKISWRVRSVIKKDNKSVIKFLPYTMQELKEHLEAQFEPWMTWENYGTYRVGIWNDQDPSTWIWQIDHIIPHSKFKYSSMEDQEFKDCWALSNLRPYSAKQNIIDGDR